MPLNGFSVGRDVSTTISTADGTLQPTLITKFTTARDSTEKKIKGLDGVTRTLSFPDGWSGAFEISRQDSTIDDYFANVDANFYSGLDQSTGTIMQTIQEVSGAVSQFQYVGVTLKLTNAGSWASDDSVEQQLSWTAERRIKVS